MARRDFKALEQRRLKAARLFEQGMMQAEVARRLKVSSMTVSRWWRTWKAEGREGLRAAGRAGRKPRLTAPELTQIEEALRRGPLAHGYSTDLWTLPRIRDVIERVTRVRYHEGHVWRVMRKLGWSLQKPTTRARERDEEAIRRWVRDRWPQVKKTPPAGEPRSSSSTRAASRNGPRSAARGRPAAKRRS
jgi:transposase